MLITALVVGVSPSAGAQQPFNGVCDIQGAYRSNRAYFVDGAVTINGRDTVAVEAVCSSTETGYDVVVEVGIEVEQEDGVWVTHRTRTCSSEDRHGQAALKCVLDITYEPPDGTGSARRRGYSELHGPYTLPRRTYPVSPV